MPVCVVADWCGDDDDGVVAPPVGAAAVAIDMCASGAAAGVKAPAGQGEQGALPASKKAQQQGALPAEKDGVPQWKPQNTKKELRKERKAAGRREAAAAEAVGENRGDKNKPSVQEMEVEKGETAVPTAWQNNFQGAFAAALRPTCGRRQPNSSFRQNY